MLTNDEMKAGRYLKLAKGRKLMRRMDDCWDRGGFVRIGTALKYWDVRPKMRNLVKLGQSGSLYMIRGRSADCIDYCSFQFSA